MILVRRDGQLRLEAGAPDEAGRAAAIGRAVAIAVDGLDTVDALNALGLMGAFACDTLGVSPEVILQIATSWTAGRAKVGPVLAQFSADPDNLGEVTEDQARALTAVGQVNVLHSIAELPWQEALQVGSFLGSASRAEWAMVVFLLARARQEQHGPCAACCLRDMQAAITAGGEGHLGVVVDPAADCPEPGTLH